MRLPPPPSRLLPRPLATLSSAMLSLMLALPLGLRAAPLPAELAGTWSQPGSVFENGQLAGGVALYLLADGRGALVGAPLPVGRCPDGRVCTPIIGSALSASFDPASRQLRLRMFENGRHLDNTLMVQLQPDGTLRMDTAPQRPPAASATTPARPAEANMLVRQEPQVPAALAAKLQQMPLEETAGR